MPRERSRPAAAPTLAASDPSRTWVLPEAKGSGVDGFPEWLGTYRRNHRLGRGGMGVVYRYRDTRLDRLVAVKTMPTEFARDPLRRQRFEQEARVLASLDHPNIGKIYHIVEHEGMDYLVLEFVPGETLFDRLGDGPLTIEETVLIGRQIAGAIAAGHARGVVHRDIKPGNIMITTGGVAKLLDYGLALDTPRPTIEPAAGGLDGIAAQPQTLTPASAQNLIRALGPFEADDKAPTASDPSLVGTPGYMSPEQARGEPSNERSDIWAFGCVLYECLTGHCAFSGRTEHEILRATLDATPDWDALPAQTPAAVRRSLARCFERDPVLRPKDIRSILGDSDLPRPSAVRNRAAGQTLPRPLTSFVGKPDRLTEVHSYMDRARLLTLTGTAGTGKTRLAIEAATETAADLAGSTSGCHGGVFFVKLTPLTAGDQVPQAVATVIAGPEGIDVAGGRSVADLLFAMIQSQHMLIVLDGCDHVAESCARFVDDLLSACPRVQVLATSRAPLGIPGELTHVVQPLACPPTSKAEDPWQYDAVRLFVDRARLVRHDFALGPANGNAIVRICRRLEGIPLAIEMAAARVRSLPVAEIANRVFDVMDPRGVLESSLRWSVDLLEPSDRELLGRLAIFHGGWTLEAAESICTDAGGGRVGDRPLIDALGQLVDKSLVRYEELGDHSRYRLLQIVREYAQRHLLDPSDAENVRRRHLDFFHGFALEAAAQFFGDEQVAWLHRLDTERANLRAAMQLAQRDDVDPVIEAELARSLHVYLYMRGAVDEARTALRRSLARQRGAGTLLEAQTLNAAAIVEQFDGALIAARGHYVRALEIVRALDDRPRTAGVLTNLGILMADVGDLAESRSYQEQAWELYAAEGNSVGVAMVQLNLTDVAIRERSFDEAGVLVEACLPVLRDAGDHQRIANAIENRGKLALCRRGSAAEAIKFLEESLGMWRELGDARRKACGLAWLSIAEERAGRWERAARLLAVVDAAQSRDPAVLTDLNRRAFQSALASVRESLDAEEFEKAWEAGRATSLDDACAIALGEI